MSEEIKNTDEKIDSSNEKTASDNTKPQNNDSRDNRRTDNRRNDNNQRPQRVPRFRKKVCRFCHTKDLQIDYKQPEVLLKFVTDRGKILPRRITGTCAKHQRALAREIKKARMIALLPFVEK